MGKVMAVTRPDQLVELLEKSELLEPEKIAQAREAAKRTDNPKSLAKALVRQGWLSRWQAGQLLAGRAVTSLGKYRLIDLLGGGRAGGVFLAEHTKMGRRVALKIVPKRLGRDPALLEQFLAQARAIAALDHPNIVHAYSVDSERDQYYLVMEYVEGQDLARMVEAQGPLPFGKAARYVQQAADGLAHAHSRNMIHGDVKPANLMVNQQDVVKILDLGMARLTAGLQDAAPEQDGSPEEAATPEDSERPPSAVDYLAPEQVSENSALDGRVDVYSLGCTFYFLLTGKPPFPEGTLDERVLKHQTEAPREIPELRPDAPQELVEICNRMMAKKPDERFQSADDVSQALAEWQSAQVELEPAEAESPVAAGSVQIKADEGSAVRKRRASPGILARIKATFTGPKRKLAFAATGGAAALIVVGGLIFALTRPGSPGKENADSEVALSETEPQAERPAEKEEPQAAEHPKADGEWPDLPDLGNLRNFDPEAALDAEKSEPAKPEAKAGPEVPASGKPENGPAEHPKPQAAAAEPEKPPAEKAPPEKAPPEKVAPEKPEPKAKPPAAKEAEKPEPEKTPPPEPKPKPKEPLKDLAEAIDLPESGEGLVGPFTIGQVHSAADVPWQLYLLGGNVAFKRNRTFVLKEGEAGAAQATWLVELESESAASGAAPEAVARIWRDGESLMFQWAERAPSYANYLRNCVLQVRVEGESKYVALSTPKPLEPIDIDLDRGIVNAVLPVKWLPDAGTLRVEIPKVEGREGHVLEPAEPAEPRKPIELSFPRTDRHGNTVDRVAFRLNFTLRPTAMQVRLQLLEPPPASFRILKGNVVIQRNTRENMLDQINRKLKPADPNQAPKGQELSTLNAAVDELEKALWYINFYDDVQGKAKIDVRLFTEVDGRQIVLAQSAAAPAAGAAPAEKAAQK
jgi:serine/threonine protein kinase